MAEPVGFPIGFVSLSTGLSTHALRAWERRYNAVTPFRSAGRRRIYTQEDIDRLTLLKQAVENGHRISEIAAFDADRLTQLVRIVNPRKPRTGALNSHRSPGAESDAGAAEALVETCLQAIEAFDGARLHETLHQAALILNRRTILDAVIRPLMHQLGRRWAEGSLRIVHEHLASEIVETHLDRMLTPPAGAREGTARVLIAAPAGQWCRLGAKAVAVTVRDHGWEPVFLGANLPSEEIAAACQSLDPQLIALSMTCRINDGFMHDELQRLSTFLDGRCAFVVGGQAAERYRVSIEAAGGSLCTTMDGLVDRLH